MNAVITGIESLFHFHFCTGLFELALQCSSFVFAHAFLDGLGGCINEFLGFLQTEAGEFLHQLHDGQLLSASALQDDVERSLLFSSGSSATSTRSSSNSNSGGCRFNTVFFLQDVSELVHFLHGKID